MAVELFGEMFKRIDKFREEKVGFAAKLFFMKCFINLFCDIGAKKEMSYTILDLLFILGDSTTCHTYSSMKGQEIDDRKENITDE